MPSSKHVATAPNAKRLVRWTCDLCSASWDETVADVWQRMNAGDRRTRCPKCDVFTAMNAKFVKFIRKHMNP